MNRFVRSVFCAMFFLCSLPGFAGSGVDTRHATPANADHLIQNAVRMPEMAPTSTGIQTELTRIFEDLVESTLRSRGNDVPFLAGRGTGAQYRSRIVAGTAALPTTVVSEYWDDIGGGWVNDSKRDYSYDGSDRVSETVTSFWADPDWEPSSRSTNTYNGDNLTMELTDSWNGTMWTELFRTTNSHDGSGNMLTSLLEAWSGSVWEGVYRWTMNYDGSNNRTDWTWESWLFSAWANTSKFLYTYDGSNRLTSFTYQTWGGSSWTNFRKTIPTYDGSDRLINDLVQAWGGSAWFDQSLYTYSYDGSDNLTESLNQTWGGSWMNNSRMVNTYDGSSNLLEELNQSWSGSMWNNNSRTNNTYSGGDLSVATSQFWNGSMWANTSRSTYTYGPATAVEDEGRPSGEFRLTENYPNPFNPSTEIGYTVGSRSHVTLVVNDLLGREVSVLVNGVLPAGSYTVRWDAANLPGGVYFYRLETDGFRETKKMVLIR